MGMPLLPAHATGIAAHLTRLKRADCAYAGILSSQRPLRAWPGAAIRSAQQGAASKRFGVTSECSAAW